MTLRNAKSVLSCVPAPEMAFSGRVRDVSASPKEPMDREDAIYQNNFREPDLSGLALLCANVAKNRSADRKQSDAAHALRVEWVQMQLDRSPHDDKVEAEEKSLKKRMAEFLAGVPTWMLRGR